MAKDIVNPNMGYLVFLKALSSLPVIFVRLVQSALIVFCLIEKRFTFEKLPIREPLEYTCSCSVANSLNGKSQVGKI